MKTTPLYYLLITVLFVSCADRVATHDTGADTLIPAPILVDRPAEYIEMNENNNPLVWQGTYRGTLPCADCDGVETILTLNEDKTFIRRMKYIGKTGRPVDNFGTFMWDDKGQSITLIGIANSSNQYSIGSNVLYQLDSQGKKIPGNLAEKYKLLKTSHSFSLRETYWRLTDLNGRTLAPGERKDVFIRLKANGMVQGSGGCNNVGGGYLLMDGNRIRFGQLVSTEMACPAMRLESELFEALSNTDNYSLSGNVLSLNNSRIGSLARFVAVQGK